MISNGQGMSNGNSFGGVGDGPGIPLSIVIRATTNPFIAKK